MKKLLAIAVATALTAPAAMADTILYGKLHSSVGELKTTLGNGQSQKTTAVESHSSRIGIRGSNDVDNGLAVTYRLEFQVDTDGDNGGGGTALADLNAAGSTSTSNSAGINNTRTGFVGLKGPFGEVQLGRMDTPAKLATARQDIFSDTYADLANIIDTDAHRVNNAIAYVNKLGPVNIAAAHSTGILSSSGVQTTSTSGVPLSSPSCVATSTGCDTNAPVGDGTNQANSLMASYATGPFYAGIGYTDVRGGSIPSGNARTANAKHTNLGLGFNNDTAAANVVLEQVKANKEVTGAAANVKDDNIVVNGSYKIGAATLKAQYGESKRKGSTAANNGKEKVTAVGVDYALGKKTNAYLLWAEDKNPAKRVNLSGTDVVKNSAVAIGIVSDF